MDESLKRPFQILSDEEIENLVNAGESDKLSRYAKSISRRLKMFLELNDYHHNFGFEDCACPDSKCDAFRAYDHWGENNNDEFVSCQCEEWWYKEHVKCGSTKHCDDCCDCMCQCCGGEGIQGSEFVHCVCGQNWLKEHIKCCSNGEMCGKCCTCYIIKAKEATLCWMLCAKKLGLCKDVSRLIGVEMFKCKMEWKYEYDDDDSCFESSE